MKPRPLKRHPALQPLSREHHDALMLCWKIRKGLAKQVEPLRIGAYAAGFFREQLEPHFSFEEEFLFPLLGASHEMVQQALREHAQLRELFIDPAYSREKLERLEKELEGHIRFEERVLFQEIQGVAGEAQMRQLALLAERAVYCPTGEDQFWL
ncbi:MAG: hemerythrin domain-containing protein [Bacteroidia bacterium]|nr:hemerythrin domain-containing protein [Bacteroidia bacterium]